jgi:hypothetical protein
MAGRLGYTNTKSLLHPRSSGTATGGALDWLPRVDSLKRTALTTRRPSGQVRPPVDYFSRAGFLLLHFCNGLVGSRRQPTPTNQP